jgi:hypothetical protein
MNAIGAVYTPDLIELMKAVPEDAAASLQVPREASETL